jgi:methylamine dehydrogenase heavy chain
MRAAITVVLAAALAGPAPAPAFAEEPVEHVTVRTLPPSDGLRLYVIDGALAHGVDGKVRVIDGERLAIMGQISNGQYGDFDVAQDGRTLFNATTFFPRGDHGDRVDVLEYYDPATLLPVAETVLPPKRAQDTGVAAFMAQSAGGEYLFIQNASPAASVTVVDVKRRAVLGEFANAGCYGVYPSPSTAGRFSSLCGDGTALTVGFDAAGRETARKRSAKLFDPDADALFSAGARLGDRMVFVSFLGNVHVLDVGGETVTQDDPFPLAAGLSGGWRPGGIEPVAAAAGHAWVLMHPDGEEGGHKRPAREVWRVDVAQRKVVSRGAAEGPICLAATADGRAVFTVDADAGVVTRLDGATLDKQAESGPHLLEGGCPIWVR